MKRFKKLWTAPLTAGGLITFMFVSDYLIRPFVQAFVNWVILNWLGIG
ncbi:MAG: hypothetical protein KAW92_10645 [Candidatus Cloacimonetes bacterium]|nr:hypothetical protein [Candidatus Cloacimonadota bacterium]